MGPCIIDPLCAAFSIDRRLMPAVSRCLGSAIFRNRSVSVSCRMVCRPGSLDWGCEPAPGGSRGLLLALPDLDLRAHWLRTPRLHRCIIVCGLVLRQSRGCARTPQEKRPPHQPRVAASGRFGSEFPGLSDGAPSAKMDPYRLQVGARGLLDLPTSNHSAFGRFGSGFHSTAH